MRDAIIRDAAEFGVHVKAGGWRLGLLVARNVEKGSGDGINDRYREGVSRETPSKVSAREFAEQAGTTAARVLRHLEAWDRAAADGIVPPADTLTPGQDVGLDADKLGEWSTYYRSVGSLDRRSPAHRKAIEAAAAEEGTTPEQVQRASASKAAIAAAIKTDPNIREAALRALDTYRPTRSTDDTTPTSKRRDQLGLITEFRKLHIAIDRIARLVVEDGVVVSDGERGALIEEVDWLANALGLIKSGLSAESLDKALAAILDDRS